MDLRSKTEHFNKPFLKLPFSHIKDYVRHSYYYGYGTRRKKMLQTSKDSHHESKYPSEATKNTDFDIKRKNSRIYNFGLNVIQNTVMTKFTSNKLNLGINSRQILWNEFWLPKITLTPQITRQIEENFIAEKKEIVSNSSSSGSLARHQQLKSFLKWKRLVDDSTSNSIHVCRLLDGRWATVTRDQLILLWDKSNCWNFDRVEIVFSLPLKHIAALSVDPSLSVIYFITGPECFSKWDIIPGEITKTERFISCLIVAVHRVRCTFERNEIGMDSKSRNVYTSIYKTRFIDVIRMPILSIPSCTPMNRYICQDKEIVLYSSSAIVKNIDSETDFQEEFMMQTEKEKFQPVILSLRGKFLKTFGSGNENLVLCDVDQISSIRRGENPRPHSVHLTWNSACTTFSASNSSSANKLFERISSSRRQKLQQSWPAHIILTDHSLFSFSTGAEKDLLFRTPILNMVVNFLNLEEKPELLIENEISEAEEYLSSESENPQWSLSFEDSLDAKTIYRLLTKLSKRRYT